VQVPASPQTVTQTHVLPTHFFGTPAAMLHASSAPGSSSTLPSQLLSLPSHASVPGVHAQTPCPSLPASTGDPAWLHVHPGTQSLAERQGSVHTPGLASVPWRKLHVADMHCEPWVHGCPTSAG